MKTKIGGWTMNGSGTVISFRQRRDAEVARQKRRNKKDLLMIAGKVIILIAWAACVCGMVDFMAGGW